MLRLSGQTAAAVAEALTTALAARATADLCPACVGILQPSPLAEANRNDVSGESRQLEGSRPGAWIWCPMLDTVAQMVCSNGHHIDEWNLSIQVIFNYCCCACFHSAR